VSDDARGADDGARQGGDSDSQRARRLRLVSFRPGRGDGSEATVQLVREYKGPTVTSLVGACSTATNRLPGQVRRVLEAIQRGDFAEADRRLDSAGKVLAGPGSRRAMPMLWPWFLMLWVVGGLATALVLGCS